MGAGGQKQMNGPVMSAEYRLTAEADSAGHPPMHWVNALPTNSITAT